MKYRVKIIEKVEQSCSGLWDNIKLSNIYAFGIPKREKKKNGIEKIISKISLPKFSKFSEIY